MVFFQFETTKWGNSRMGFELFLLIEQILIASQVRSLVKSQKSIFMKEYSFFFFITPSTSSAVDIILQT